MFFVAVSGICEKLNALPTNSVSGKMKHPFNILKFIVKIIDFSPIQAYA